MYSYLVRLKVGLSRRSYLNKGNETTFKIASCHLDGQCKKNVCQMFADSISSAKMIRKKFQVKGEIAGQINNTSCEWYIGS